MMLTFVINHVVYRRRRARRRSRGSNAGPCMGWRKREMRNEARMSFRISGKDSIPVAIPVWRRQVGFRASAAAPFVTQPGNGSTHRGANSPRVTHFSISLIGMFVLYHDRKSSGSGAPSLPGKRGRAPVRPKVLQPNVGDIHL
jgi:hypothetical protein